MCWLVKGQYLRRGLRLNLCLPTFRQLREMPGSRRRTCKSKSSTLNRTFSSESKLAAFKL
ncbi:hypothetical protein EUZ87_02350 [Lactiplantibacillus paraplantarum]|uniref:Uncharacterized protein n=1 Tax=Lactiplantibacillus paraplantarum TaxID=60520 RepID=A0A4Q9Y933_9LACO|nr:hypothetical protein EUZ87_02350 [Lactiplantibacillus paraplantarum]